MKYTLDRFEEDKAVLLLRNDESIQRDINKSDLPLNAKEGDILNVKFSNKQEILTVKILKEETTSAKNKIKEMQKKLLNKNKN